MISFTFVKKYSIKIIRNLSTSIEAAVTFLFLLKLMDYYARKKEIQIREEKIRNMVNLIKQFSKIELPIRNIIENKIDFLEIKKLSVNHVIKKYNLLEEMVKYNSFGVYIRHDVLPNATLLSAHDLYRFDYALEAMNTPFSLPRQNIKAHCPENIISVVIEFINVDWRGGMND